MNASIPTDLPRSKDRRAVERNTPERRDHIGRPTVSVIIPTLNEALNIPHVFSTLPNGLNELIVVDGHSQDDTALVVKDLRPDARVILQDKMGKGNALSCGFAASRGDIIVMLDADGSTNPGEIPRFLRPLMEGNDFAKGSRFLEGGGSNDITRIRSLGNRLLCSGVNLMFGTKYTDLCYGYNAFWRGCLPYLQVICEGFEVETVINVRAAKSGFSIMEVPSFESSRLNGVSNLNAFSDGKRVLRAILGEYIRPLPEPSNSWIPQFSEIFPSVEERMARLGLEVKGLSIP